MMAMHYCMERPCPICTPNRAYHYYTRDLVAWDAWYPTWVPVERDWFPHG